MSYFTAIDFETANGNRNSVCQVGLVIVEDCKIVDRIKYLIKPPGNLYHKANIGIHGITPEMTEHAETFDKVYAKIKQHIEGKNIVAHNAKFDINCLGAALMFYKIKMPKLKNAYCTYQIYGQSLSIACAMNNIIYIKPHDALEDAESCALLMIKDIRKYAKERQS